jgi:Fur family ferric uptake transcriptional regulator
LYDMVRRRLPRISLGTVYRNLELLTQNGMIQKLPLGGGEARFDGQLSPHHHVRCVRCGRVDDVDDLGSVSLPNEPKRAGGYEILGCRFEFFGLCPRCRTDRPTAPGVGSPDQHRTELEGLRRTV